MTDDEIVKKAQEMFDKIQTSSNKKISDLMTLTKQILDAGLVKVMVSSAAKNMTLMGSVFVIPETILDTKDELHKLGGCVYIASQFRDWYNGEMYSAYRSMAYEAEFVSEVYNKSPAGSIQLNTYQFALLKSFPHGLKSLLPMDIYNDRVFDGKAYERNYLKDYSIN